VCNERDVLDERVTAESLARQVVFLGHQLGDLGEDLPPAEAPLRIYGSIRNSTLIEFWA
jgi:hypothetical protein